MHEESTRDKIIRVGFNLMRTKGFDHVTVNEICQAVQISKHTFYYYFDSKEDILKGFSRIPHELKQEILAQIVTLDSPLEQYLAVIKPKIQYLESCGVEIIKKMLVSNLTAEPTLSQSNSSQKSCHPLLDLETSLIEKAQKKKEIRNLSDPRKMTEICFTLMVGMAQIWATTETHFSLTERYLEAVKTILCAEIKMPAVSVR